MERKIVKTRTTQIYSRTPTEIISTVDGVNFAYRRLGSGGDLPLVLAGYFASNMDDWDPLIVDGLAAEREVITFDYPGRLYVAMRLINSADLQTLLKDGPLDHHRAVRITERVASAPQAAHKVGLVHRDVKPSNILIAEDDFAYLTDFSIARAVGDTGLTSTGATIGTWAYMAPERFSTRDIKPSSDIYALACALYQSLTGQLPFPGTTLEQIAMAHMSTSPPKPSAQRRGIPMAMDDAVATGMAKKPDQRYRTAKDLAQAARATLRTPVRQIISRTSLLTTQAAVDPLPKTAAAKPSSQYVQKFLPLAGRWAEVVATGDDHHGQVGRISAVCDDEDEDDLDVIVEFRADPSSYAFRRDELAAAEPPANAVASGDQFPKAPWGVKRPEVSVSGVILFLVFLPHHHGCAIGCCSGSVAPIEGRRPGSGRATGDCDQHWEAL